MERVVAVGLGASGLGGRFPGGAGAKAGKIENGVVEKVLGPGRFIVNLADGQRVQVQGAASLPLGRRVQVVLPAQAVEPARMAAPAALQAEAGGYLWSALIPLGFGGVDAYARLEVFVEKRRKMILEKSKPAVYFVFTSHTRDQGELQWSVYLKERQVALQVHADSGSPGQEKIAALARTVEERLRSLGFILMGPTVFLRKPFKAPPGFRLNVEG